MYPKGQSPIKITSADAATDQIQEQQTKKSGPGRPRKNVDPDAEQQTKKRGRGRPRKNVEPTILGHFAAYSDLDHFLVGLGGATASPILEESPVAVDDELPDLEVNRHQDSNRIPLQATTSAADVDPAGLAIDEGSSTLDHSSIGDGVL